MPEANSMAVFSQSACDWIDDTRLTVLVGHFGSGKTEIALNLSMALAKRNHNVMLVDLDVVDPYFRSRECRWLIESNGGRLISGSQACVDADVPSLPPEVSCLFDDKDTYGILDIGGDASGARVLARYRRRLKQCGARILCVVNANRPLTSTPERAETYIRGIEDAAGLPVSGLIHNTHLCNQTEEQDIFSGAELVRRLSASTGIPLICHAVTEHLAPKAAMQDAPVLPIRTYLKKPWE